MLRETRPAALPICAAAFFAFALPLQAWGGLEAPPPVQGPSPAEVSPPAEAPPPETELDAENTVISALQRQGDLRFRADDYAGARKAYLDALSRVPQGPTDAAFRVSLIVLVVNATVAEFAVVGDQAPVREVLDLVEAEQADEALDPELVEILAQASSRLEPLLPQRPPAPAAAPLPVAPLPAAPDGEVVLEAGSVAPRGLDPALSLLIAGSVTAAAGFAAIGAGASFKPRATAQVEDSGFAVDDALPFVNGEIRKGQAWIGVGAGVAATGIALLVTGATLRLRSRGRANTGLSLAGSRRELVVGLRGRW